MLKRPVSQARGGEGILTSHLKDGTWNPQEGTVCSRPWTVCQARRTEGPNDVTVCPSGKGIDPFKGAEATLGGTVCPPGGTAQISLLFLTLVKCEKYATVF